MANFKQTVITKAAHNLIAKSLSGSANINFTRVATSKYDYKSFSQSKLESLTSLEDIKQYVAVDKVEKIGEASVNVSVKITNANITEGYYVNTIGLFAMDPEEGEILYSVTVAETADYFPADNGVNCSGINLDLVTEVSNASNVNITVNYAGYATNEDIEKVNSQLNDMAKLDLLDNDLILFASYQSGNFSSVNDFTLYVGNSIDKCYPINNEKLLTYITNRPLWDICTFRYDNKICFIGDYKDSDSVWGGNAFLLIETEDFINYKQSPFKIISNDKNITQTWAPKVFMDSEDVYLIYSIQEDNEKYIDDNLLNTEHEKLKMCYSKALDNTLTNWSEPIYFNVGTEDCIIDPFLLKKDGIYHLFGCYDNNAEIRHYTGTTLNGAFEYKGVIPFPNITEAPSVIEYNNKYYMYVDSHRATGGRDSGLIQVMESNDLYNWSGLKTLKNTARTKMRHFAPCVIETSNEKNTINNLFNTFNLNNNFINSNDNIYSSEKNNISYFNLASITPKDSNIIEELYVMPNTIYYKNSNVDNITINKINTTYLNNFDEFHFVLNSFDKNNSITIKDNSNLGRFLPTHEDLVINGEVGSVFYSFTSLDKYIKCITPLRYNPIKRGTGIGNSNYIVTTGNDFECKYVVSNNVCVVSYVFKFTEILPTTGVVASNLPIPIVEINFSTILNETNDYNKYSTFRINDNGEIVEWYSFKPPINSVVKGSFTYIIK